MANPLARDWVDNRLRERLNKLLGEMLEQRLTLEISTGPPEAGGAA